MPSSSNLQHEKLSGPMSNTKSFLKQIYPTDGAEDVAVVDIIAVHGLDPFNKADHARSTWTFEDRHQKDTLWLSDLLPRRCNAIRVLLYGYNSSAVFGASNTGVNGAAENLLNYLRVERKGKPDRPIIWVAHSLGGIVVKKAIINAYVSGEYFGSIHDATKGVIFFATPHRGGHLATFGDQLAHVARAVCGDARNDIMEALRKDSMFAGDVQKDFARRAHALHLRVLNFTESLPIVKHFGLVVPSSSAVLGWAEPAEVQISVEATHSTICKFGENSDMYKRVEDNIVDLLDWATSTIDAEPAHTVVPVLQNLDLDDSDNNNQLPEPHLPARTRSFSLGASGSSVPTTRPWNGFRSGSWLSGLSSLRPLLTKSSNQSLATSSITSSDGDGSLADSVWPIIMLPHPRASKMITRAPIFESLLTAAGAGPVTVHGIGGVGKTQLAVKLAYWFLDRDPEFSVIWLHAATSQSCIAGLRAFAEQCGLINSKSGTETSDPPTSSATVAELLILVRKRLLEAPKHKWLLVLDSADDTEALFGPLDASKVPVSNFLDSLLREHGYIVFTTKSRSAAVKYTPRGTILEVGKLTLDEATLMLEVGVNETLLLETPVTPRLVSGGLGAEAEWSQSFGNARQYHNDRASELADKLDRLPLAISQAAAFMNKNHLSISSYLARMSASNDEMLAELMSRPQDQEAQVGVPASVYATWRLSYEIIRKHNRLAADVLAFLSFIEQNSMPLSLLKAALPGGEDDVKLIDALGQLRDYELVYAGAARDTFAMHRLVQATTRKWLKESKLETQWARAVLMTLAANFPDANDVKTWPLGATWLPHANKVVRNNVLQNTADSPALATLHLALGRYYFRTGQWSEARHSIDCACDMRSTSIGPMEPRTLEAKDLLVQVQRELGQYTQAEATAREIKRYRKRTLGRKNALTLQSYHVLGICYSDQGKYVDAAHWTGKALKGFRELHATDPFHIDVLMSMYRVGHMQCIIGEIITGEALMLEASKGFQNRGEEESLQAAQVMFGLAFLQRSLGKYRESEQTARKCQKVRQTILGRNHPDTLKALHAMGWALLSQERFEESTDVFTEVVAACNKRVGEHHHYTYTASFNLADSLEGLGEYEEAKDLHEKILAGRKRVLNHDHPDILMSQVRLASILQVLGKNSTVAEQLTLDVYRTLKKDSKTSRDGRPIIWACMSNMSRIYASRAATTAHGPEKQARWEEAIRWARLHVEAAQKLLGTEHPETRKAGKQLMACLDAFGDRTGARGVGEIMLVSAPPDEEKSSPGLASRPTAEKPVKYSDLKR